MQADRGICLSEIGGHSIRKLNGLQQSILQRGGSKSELRDAPRGRISDIIQRDDVATVVERNGNKYMNELKTGGRPRRGLVGYVAIAAAVLVNLRFAQWMYVSSTQVVPPAGADDWQQTRAAVRSVWIIADFFLALVIWETRGKIGASNFLLATLAKIWSRLFPSQQIRMARQLLTDKMEELFQSGKWSISTSLEQANTFGLSDDDPQKFIKEFAQKKLNCIVRPLLSQELIAPDGFAKIIEVRARLDGFELDDKTSAAVSHACYLWSVYNDPLSPIDAEVLLKRGERCFLAARCAVTEHRTETSGVRYAGPTARVRLGRHISYRAGSYSVHRTTRDIVFSHGRGSFYATDKRLLWVGDRDTISIPLNSIVKCDPYLNGIQVTRDRGKPLFFNWGSQNKIQTVLAERVITEMR